MDAKSKTHRQAHAILVPTIAQGHMNPFLSLAALLRRHSPNLAITLVSTPANIASLSKTVDTSLSLQLHSLPFDHGLPANDETISSVSFHQHLLYASESLRPAFDEFISCLVHANPDMDVCIVTDIFMCWTLQSARLIGIAHSVLITGGAYGMGVYFSLWKNVPLTFENDDIVLLPEFPDLRIERSQLTPSLVNGTQAWSEFIHRQILGLIQTDVVLINTVEEIEPSGFKIFRQWCDSPIYPIGPLTRTSASDLSDEDHKILEWLGKKPPSSVLYISFGSMFTIQSAQMMELAMGLEESKCNFIWVMKPPVGFNVKGEFKAEWLPEGFEERMESEGRGQLVRRWAPQVEILAHASTGGFPSHCGWNSVLESLSHGVPIIGWPLAAEQFHNSNMLVEEELCVELARGNGDNTRLDKAMVVEVVEMVIGETEKGIAMRSKAAKMEDYINAAWREGEGSSAMGLEKFFKVVTAKATSF